ncbi:hypothetical protein C8J56DRAFT_982549 [Mycena floridula]|nr:hypothetical protein C8J56DRAFT_982549 [Mycena floridula]
MIHRFKLSVAQCHLNYYDLSTTSWRVYPVALLCLGWHIRTAKKNGRALLMRIQVCSDPLSRITHRLFQKKDEGENIRRIADVELANLRRRHAFRNHQLCTIVTPDRGKHREAASFDMVLLGFLPSLRKIQKDAVLCDWKQPEHYHDESP